MTSRRRLVHLVALALGAVLVTFAWHGYPAPSTDAPSFVVSAINLSRGRGLVNPLYPQIAVADPSGLERHVYYPPLFPLVLAHLMIVPAPQHAFLAVAILRAASLLLAGHLLLRIGSGRDSPLTWPVTLMIITSLCGLCTNWLPTVGRPEALGTLLVLVAALATPTLRPKALVPALGVLLGLLGATQPFGALEAALLLGLYLAAHHPARAAMALAAATGVLALLAFAAVLALGPHGLGETLRGMARAYPATPWHAPPGPDWWRPWLLHRKSAFYGPLLLASLACGTHLLLRSRTRLGSAPLIVALAALLAGCLYHGSLTHGSRRNYNALVLSPLFYGSVVAWFAATAVGPRSLWRRAARRACVLCVLATTTGFFAYVACFPWFVAQARGLSEARAEWRRLDLPPTAHFFVVGHAWTLSEDYDRMQLGSRPLLGEAERLRRVVLLGQRQDDSGRAPPEIRDFRVVRDFFNPAMASGGLRSRYVEEDYSFAVYVPR